MVPSVISQGLLRAVELLWGKLCVAQPAEYAAAIARNLKAGVHFAGSEPDHGYLYHVNAESRCYIMPRCVFLILRGSKPPLQMPQPMLAA